MCARESTYLIKGQNAPAIIRANPTLDLAVPSRPRTTTDARAPRTHTNTHTLTLKASFGRFRSIFILSRVAYGFFVNRENARRSERAPAPRIVLAHRTPVCFSTRERRDRAVLFRNGPDALRVRSIERLRPEFAGMRRAKRVGDARDDRETGWTRNPIGHCPGARTVERDCRSGRRQSVRPSPQYYRRAPPESAVRLISGRPTPGPDRTSDCSALIGRKTCRPELCRIARSRCAYMLCNN